MHPISRMLSRRQNPRSTQDKADLEEARDRSLLRLLANRYFADDFERPDTTGGTDASNNGLANGWFTTGSGYLAARITDGAYVTTGNCYAWRQLTFTPQRMSMLVRFGASDSSITLVSSVDIGLVANCVHVFFQATTMSIQIRVANASTNLASAAYSLDRDSLHEVAYEVSGDTVTAFVDGVQVAQGTNAQVSDLIGVYATWQIQTGADSLPRIEYVEAIAAAIA